MLYEKRAFKNTCAGVSFLIKLQVEACNFIKKDVLTEVYSYEFCKIFKNTFFTEHFQMTASMHYQFHFIEGHKNCECYKFKKI